jgi:hypothetical protein
MGTNTAAAGYEGAAPDPVESRREVSALVNAEIRKLAATQARSFGEIDEVYAFICQCGCMKFVDVSLGVYDRAGAWLDGHKP